MNYSTITELVEFASGATKAVAKAEWGTYIEKSVRIVAILATYLYVIGSIAFDAIVDVTRQTVDAVNERSEQIADLLKFTQELAYGVSFESDFMEIREVPEIAPASTPVALLNAAPEPPAKPKRRRTTRRKTAPAAK